MTAVLGPAFAPAEVRRIVAGSGSSFATGMRVLPRARREAIFAVYAFCRVVDDIADGDGDGASKLRRLRWWEEEVGRVFEGAPRDAIGGELARAARAYELPREELDLVLEGMRMDALGVVAPDDAGFERYVRCVAGAVGVLSLRVFGAWRGEGSARFALSLARAMQITNILRDVEEDAGLGRLYLPRALVDAVGLPREPGAALAHPALPEARRRLGEEARAEYARARGLARGHAWGRLLPAYMMMGPYETLLHRMALDWTRAPPRRPGWRKAADGVGCALGSLVRR